MPLMFKFSILPFHHRCIKQWIKWIKILKVSWDLDKHGPMWISLLLSIFVSVLTVKRNPLPYYYPCIVYVSKWVFVSKDCVSSVSSKSLYIFVLITSDKTFLPIHIQLTPSLMWLLSCPYYGHVINSDLTHELDRRLQHVHKC